MFSCDMLHNYILGNEGDNHNDDEDEWIGDFMNHVPPNDIHPHAANNEWVELCENIATSM